MKKFLDALKSALLGVSWRTVNICLDNNLARSALLMPIIGYAIIMNDYISNNFVFNNLTSNSEHLISTGLKLRLLYIGLFLIGIAYVFYKLFRPKAFDISIKIDDYSIKYLESITAYEISLIIEKIEKIERNNKQKYILNSLEEEIRQIKSAGIKFLNWREKPQFRDVFISLIKLDFENQIQKNKLCIYFCIFTVIIGYGFIVISSFDILYRVKRSFFR